MKNLILAVVVGLVVGGCAESHTIISCPEKKAPDGEFYYSATKGGYQCCDGFIDFSNSDVDQKVKLDSGEEEVWIITKKYCFEGTHGWKDQQTYQVNRKDLFLYSDADIYKPFRDKILKRQEIPK